MTAIWLVTTIGFVLCLGFVGGTIFYFLREALNSEDASRIDPINSGKDPEN
ncbi:hypothetical protein [Neobacillus soli]|uniref:hypothetical protein n=1 Tax=Neobacillus soli TaxID=220688 RepID=UPI000AC69600|nr:hypothetical protein [Neobacillus soli]